MTKRDYPAAFFGLLFLFTVQGSGFAQGLVQFNNRNTSVIPAVDARIYIGYSDPFLVPKGSGFRAALLGGPTNATPYSIYYPGTLTMLASPLTGATWTTFRTGALGGYVAVGTDNTRTVPNVPYGGMAMVQVVAWQGTHSNWTDAFAHSGFDRVIGVSTPLLIPVTAGATDTNATPLFGLQSFSMFGPHLEWEPAFFYQTPSDQSAWAGNTVTFKSEVGAYPSALRQWQFNNVNLPGATSDILTLTNIRPNQAGVYRIVVSGTYNSASAEATLTVKDIKLQARGFSPSGFNLQLEGDLSLTYRLLGSSNLIQWTDLGAFSNQSGLLVFKDPDGLNSDRRFYRAVLQ
jgi:hypothetical protein